MANPFSYGSPVEGARFAGRAEELAALTARMRDGINVVVISPRRYGKTSLLRRAIRQHRQSGGAVLHVNVLLCRNATMLATHLANDAWTLEGRWHRAKHTTATFVRRLRVTPSVTFDGDKPTFRFSADLTAEDVDTVISDIYRVLAELDQPAALVLDEFQAITDLGPHLPGLLKGLADELPQVSLVLAGSRRHLMERLVSARDAPLYGMAEHVALDVIPDAVMVGFLRRRSQAGGKPMTAEAASWLLEQAGPIPNDIQHLAYEAFDGAGARVTTADVAAGFGRVVAHESSMHATRFEALPAGQRRVVLELASTPATEPYAAAFAQRVGLASPASVRKAVHKLLDDELVVARHGTLRVSDPFFAGWLRQASPS